MANLIFGAEKFSPKRIPGLKALTEPRKDILDSSQETLGQESLPNAQLRDFTIENTPETKGHWVLDDVYNEEQGGHGFIGEDLKQNTIDNIKTVELNKEAGQNQYLYRNLDTPSDFDMNGPEKALNPSFDQVQEMKATNLNGTSQYWSKAQPANLLSNGTFESGVNTDNFAIAGGATVIWNDTELGRTGNYCSKIITANSGQGIAKEFLTIGKNYKLSLRYKGTTGIKIGNIVVENLFGSFSATSQWNTIELNFIATTTAYISFLATGAGTFWIDDISIIEDMGLDLNSHTERVLHSKNRNWELTFNPIYASDFSAGLDGWAMQNGSAEYNIDGIAGENDVLKIYANDTNGTHRVSKTVIGAGKLYLISFSYFIPSSNSNVNGFTVNAKASGEASPSIGISTESTIGKWTTVSYMFMTDYNTAKIYFYQKAGATTNFIGANSASDDILYLKNISIKEIPNLVQNSGLDSDTVWTKGAGWTISGGTANCDGNSNDIFQNGGILGKKYRITYSISNYVSGQIRARLGTGGIGTYRNANGTYTEDIIMLTSAYYGFNSNAFVGSIDNVHCYEIPDWAGSGNHSIDWTTETAKSGSCSGKLTATGAGLGNNLIPSASSDFATDGLGWWAVSNCTGVYNVASQNATVTSTIDNDSFGLYKTLLLTENKYYKVTFRAKSTNLTIPFNRIVNNTTNNFVALSNPPLSSEYQNYSFISQASGTTSFRIYIYQASGNLGKNFTIDDIVIQEYNDVSLPATNLLPMEAQKKYTIEGWALGKGNVLGADLTATILNSATGWTLNAGTSISGGKLIFDGTTNVSALYNALNAGSTYSAVFRITKNSGGDLQYRLGYGSSYQTIVDNQSYIAIPSGDGRIQFSTSAGFNGTVDLITIKQVTLPSLTLAIGSQTKTFTGISCVPNVWTKVVMNIQATASEVNQALKAWINQADVVYVDELRIKERYDLIINQWIKTNKPVDQTQRTLSLYKDANNYIEFYNVSTGSDLIDIKEGTNRAFIGGTGLAIRDQKWHLITAKINGIGNTDYYLDSILKTSSSINGFGIISDLALFIGGYTGAFTLGQIAPVQIIRFNDIVASNPDLTDIYQNGFKSSYTNGEIVAWYDWENQGTDSSARGNTLTATGSPTIETVGRSKQLGTVLNGVDQYWKKDAPVNLLSNGNFETGVNTDNWTVNGGTPTWNDTELGKVGNYCLKFVSTSSSQGIYKAGLLTVGKNYTLTLKCKGTCNIRIGDNSNDTAYGDISATSQWNTVNLAFRATGDRLKFYSGSAGTIWIDDIDIREDMQMDLNGAELQKHSKNKDFSLTLGAELVTNGDFTAWTGNLPNGWNQYGTPDATNYLQNVSGGLRIVSDGLGMGVVQSILVIGKKYRISFSAIVNSGSARIIVGGNGQVIVASTTGTYNTEIVNTGTNTNLYVIRNAECDVIIDNVSVKEIPNLVTNGTFDSDTIWSKNANASISGGVAHFTGVAGGSAGVWQPLLIIGKKYRVTYTVLNYVAGGVRVSFGSAFGATRTANGTYTEDGIQASNTNLYFEAVGVTTLDIDNVHVYEIPEWAGSGNHSIDWTTEDKFAGNCAGKIVSTGAGLGAELITGFTNGTIQPYSTFVSNGVNISSAITTGASGCVSNAIALTNGKVYAVTFNSIINSGSPANNISFTDAISGGGNALSNIGFALNINGMNVVYLTATSTATGYLLFRNNTGVAGNWSATGISVKEVLGEAILPKEQFTIEAGKKYTIETRARGTGVLGSELVTGWTNSASNPLETFTSSGSAITSAINTTNSGIVYSNSFNVVLGEQYKCTFDLILNSGTAPTIYIVQNGDMFDINVANSQNAINGTNTVYFAITDTRANCEVIFRNASGVASNYSVTNFSLKKITQPAITLALGNQLKTITNISCIPNMATNSTKVVWNFQATANEVNKDLKLIVSQADTVFIDEVSIRQGYDLFGCTWLQSTDSAQTYRGLVGKKGSGNTIYWALIVGATNTISLELRDGVSNNDINITNVSNFNGSPKMVLFTVNRTGDINFYVYSSAGVLTGTRTFNLGVITNSAGIGVGGNIAGAQVFNGQISHTQVTRFDDIALAGIDPAVIYQNGIPDSYPGGNPVIPLNVKWTNQDGTDSTGINNLTGVGTPTFGFADIPLTLNVPITSWIKTVAGTSKVDYDLVNARTQGTLVAPKGALKLVIDSSANSASVKQTFALTQGEVHTFELWSKASSATAGYIINIKRPAGTYLRSDYTWGAADNIAVVPNTTYSKKVMNFLIPETGNYEIEVKNNPANSASAKLWFDDFSLTKADNFSMLMWVKSNGYVNNGSAFNAITAVGAQSNGDAFRGYGLYLENASKLCFKIDAITHNTNFVLNDNKYHLIGISIDRDGNSTIFCDLAVNTVLNNLMPKMTPLNRVFYLGKDGISTERLFNGTLGEYQVIKNKLFTAQEISDIYNGLVCDHFKLPDSYSEGEIICHYKFLDNFNDSSGKGHHLTAAGTPLPQIRFLTYGDEFYNLTAGEGFNYESQLTGENSAYQDGHSLFFDGIDDYMYILGAGAAEFNPGLSDFTLEVNVKCDQENKPIINKWSGTSGWKLSSNASKYPEFIISNGTTTVTLTGNVALTDGSLVAVTINRAGNAVLYQDGVAKDTKSAVALTEVTNSNDLLIGKLDTVFTSMYVSEIAITRDNKSAQTIMESAHLPLGWIWDGQGAIAKANVQGKLGLVISGGGDVYYRTNTLTGKLYKKMIDNNVYYINEPKHIIHLSDGVYGDLSLKEVINASFAGTTLEDQTSLNHDGTLVNGLENDNPAHPSALRFDGVDDYITFNDVADVTNKDFLLGAWVYISDLTSTQQIISKASSGHVVNFFFDSSDKTFTLNLNNTANNILVKSSPLTVGGWYLAAATADRDGNAQVYVNGLPSGNAVSIAAVSAHSFNSSNPLVLGKKSDASSEYQKGLIGTFFFSIFDGEQGAPSSLPVNISSFIIKLYNTTKKYYGDK